MPMSSKAPIIIAVMIISASFQSDAAVPPQEPSQPQAQAQPSSQSQAQPAPIINNNVSPISEPTPSQSQSQQPTAAAAKASRPPAPSNTTTTGLQRKRAMESMAMEFIQAHNEVRANYSEPPLKWDRTLARYARRYANKFKVDCNSTLTHSNGPYGENLFWGLHTHWTPTKIVQIWAKEVKDYLWNTYNCVVNTMCGHFTQIVWRDTLRLGCARVVCDVPGLFAICSYDPPGNYVGHSPFLTMPPQPIFLDD